MKKFKTEQENFWAGKFGEQYIKRNISNELIASNINLFGKILNNCSKVNSVIEYGANAGLNLIALKSLLPDAVMDAVEINAKAVKELKKLNWVNVHNDSLLNFKTAKKYDFSFTKGVLIHINPEYLPKAYNLLYKTSKKYICIIEYYNPSPVSINYRGEPDKLFKRDFAGEMLNIYSDLRLVDYGFVYHGDLQFPQDDLTWFLLEKRNK